jgi:hypothetical protein
MYFGRLLHAHSPALNLLALMHLTTALNRRPFGNDHSLLAFTTGNYRLRSSAEWAGKY